MADFLTVAGTKMFVSADLPATIDEPGFDALTFTELPIATEFGEIGPTDNIVNFIPAQGGPVQKAQGSRDFGMQMIPFAYVSDDPGIAIIETAHGSRASFSCKVEFPNGDIRYYIGVSDGVREQIGTADSVLGMATTVHLTSEVIKENV